MHAAPLLLGIALLPGCAARPGSAAEPARHSALLADGGRFAGATAPSAEPPAVWLGADRDVLLQGQRPTVQVYAANADGVYRQTADFALRDARNALVPGGCDGSMRADGMSSSAYVTLNFECQHPRAEGLHQVVVFPSRIGLSGPPVQLPLRVLKTPPSTRSATERLGRAPPQRRARMSVPGPTVRGALGDGKAASCAPPE